MSIKVMSEVWEHAPFVGTDLLVLLALADMANDDRECWPSVKHVAHKGRITQKQAAIVLKNLELQGIIEIKHRQTSDGGNTSNMYYIKTVPQWDLLVIYDEDNPLPIHDAPPPHAHGSTLPPHMGVPYPKATGKKVIEPSLNPHINPQPSRKREKKVKTDTIPAPQMNAMKDAIVAAFGWNAERMTKSEWGVIQKVAKELCTAGFESERVVSYHAWCKAKFTKGFTPAALTVHLSEYRASRLETQPTSEMTEKERWASIPELRGITEIIR